MRLGMENICVNFIVVFHTTIDCI